MFAQATAGMASAIVAVCALVILVLGTRLTRVADLLADRTGWGEAMTGALLLGASTSLPGVVLSVTAAVRGHPELAMTNAVGGIAAQTFFLAIADLSYRRANLEHAAASLPNLMQLGLLTFLLTLICLARFLPDWTFWSIHPATVALLVSYGYGLKVVSGARDYPMWRPARTTETREDEPEAEEDLPSARKLWLQFLPLVGALGVAGFVLEGAASRLVSTTGVSETSVGLVLTSVATSLPELVTSIAAVRRGALTLAVGGILGGNAFDTLFCAASDVAYRSGSVYHATSDSLMTWLLLTVLMCAVLVMGLLRREKAGPAGIGAESVTILGLYGLGVVLVFI